jgi:hypothetical protein
VKLFGRGADRAGGGHGAQQSRPPEREHYFAVDFEPEVVVGLQGDTLPISLVVSSLRLTGWRLRRSC